MTICKLDMSYLYSGSVFVFPFRSTAASVIGVWSPAQAENRAGIHITGESVCFTRTAVLTGSPADSLVEERKNLADSTLGPGRETGQTEPLLAIIVAALAELLIKSGFIQSESEILGDSGRSFAVPD